MVNITCNDKLIPKYRQTLLGSMNQGTTATMRL